MSPSFRTAATAGIKSNKLRRAKNTALNRLFKSWKLRPTEEQAAQLHLLEVERQLHVVLNVERDVELHWCELARKHKSVKDISTEMESYLHFDKLLKPYLCGDDGLGTKRLPLEKEGGIPITFREVVQVRKGVHEVLKYLREEKAWVPQGRTRRTVSEANWVARLASLTSLAKTSTVLDADKELTRLLKQDSFRKLGSEVLVGYSSWWKLIDTHHLKDEWEAADSAKKVSNQNIVENVDEIRRMYSVPTLPPQYVPQTRRRAAPGKRHPMAL